MALRCMSAEYFVEMSSGGLLVLLGGMEMNDNSSPSGNNLGQSCGRSRSCSYYGHRNHDCCGCLESVAVDGIGDNIVSSMVEPDGFNGVPAALAEAGLVIDHPFPKRWRKGKKDP
ncbi:hypothetical protein Tco_0185424 [Tanacetum coccineum]